MYYKIVSILKKGELVIFNSLLIVSSTTAGAEIAALSAACLWLFASVVYGVLGQRIPPLQLNLVKGVIAIALLLIQDLRNIYLKYCHCDVRK